VVIMKRSDQPIDERRGKGAYLDGSSPATLHNGAVSKDFPTLQDAVTAWNRLRPEQAQKASIKIVGGKLYAAAEIRELVNGSRSKET
jgi:hypothetical protein